MSEYDLVCDACGRIVAPVDGAVSWERDERGERGFLLTHVACVPARANVREELRRLVWPNEFLRFVGERFGEPQEDGGSLRAIVGALAPFVMRPDNAAEMDGMRAATFGVIPGVKPGSKARPREESPTDAGK